MPSHPFLLLPVLAVLLAACSGSGPAPSAMTDGAASASSQTVTSDAAVRSAPVVPGRPGRVFIMAGLGANCEALGEPQITIMEPPQKGEVSFVAGQETTVLTSASGTCTGQRAKGTGIYYTARPGTQGSDRFSISARLKSGETTTRSFEVHIEP